MGVPLEKNAPPEDMSSLTRDPRLARINADLSASHERMPAAARLSPDSKYINPICTINGPYRCTFALRIDKTVDISAVLAMDPGIGYRAQGVDLVPLGLTWSQLVKATIQKDRQTVEVIAPPDATPYIVIGSRESDKRDAGFIQITAVVPLEQMSTAAACSAGISWTMNVAGRKNELRIPSDLFAAMMASNLGAN